MNWVLVLTMFCLLVFGVFSIYGASWTRESEYLRNSWNRQIVWIAVGTGVFFVTALIDYRWVNWGAIPLYLGSLALLIALLFLGVEKSGARSWLDIGGFSLQPSQPAITSGILLLALVLSRLQSMHRFFRHPFVRLLACGLIFVPPFLLVLKEPDIGSAAVWLPVVGAMLLVGSIPFRYLIVITLAGTMVVPVTYFFVLKSYQKARIDTYLDMLMGRPFDEQGAGWVPRHCMIAIGSGGWEGKGFRTRSSVSNTWLPEDVVINDFIFATIAEEQGFRGAMILLSGQALLLLQCIFVAFYARDQFGRLICVGVITLIFTHVFMNAGMNILLVPITGLPLPLISYGGTFVLVIMFLLGLVQSVWVHRDAAIAEKEKAPGF
ncbi:MAG: FtsW/RodA/SpoVE family cell cycle protein [Verrucomicrobiales bacterium]